MLQNQTLSAIISSLRAFDLFSDTLDILIISFVFYQLIQLQFVIRHDLPKLGNIKGSQSCTAGNQNTLCCLSRDKLSRTF